MDLIWFIFSTRFKYSHFYTKDDHGCENVQDFESFNYNSICRMQRSMTATILKHSDNLTGTFKNC